MIAATPSIEPGTSPAAWSYVLLVDDHEPSLKTLDKLVELSGHPCLSAHSGTDAVRLCDLRRPRVVVTDLAMPNLDGCGLARWIRTRYPSIPIILMTGQQMDQRSLADLRRTFTAVLSKPVDVDHLLGLIDRLMPSTSKPVGDDSTAEGRP